MSSATYVAFYKYCTNCAHNREPVWSVRVRSGVMSALSAGKRSLIASATALGPQTGGKWRQAVPHSAFAANLELERVFLGLADGTLALLEVRPNDSNRKIFENFLVWIWTEIWTEIETLEMEKGIEDI